MTVTENGWMDGEVDILPSPLNFNGSYFYFFVFYFHHAAYVFLSVFLFTVASRFYSFHLAIKMSKIKLGISFKMEVIQAEDNDPNVSKISLSLKLDLPESTLRGSLKNKASIKNWTMNILHMRRNDQEFRKKNFRF